MLAGCGFHLRALQQELPFSLVAVEGESELARQLRLQLGHLPGTRVLPDEHGAQAVIRIQREDVQRAIIALTRSGKVAEYQLRYFAEYTVRASGNETVLAPVTIELRRDFPYDDQATLAKEIEEAQLVESLRTQAIEVILRRVSALRDRPFLKPAQ